MTVPSASAISFGRTAPEVTSVFESAVTNSMSAKPTAVLIPVSFMPAVTALGWREADPTSSPDRSRAARTVFPSPAVRAASFVVPRHPGLLSQSIVVSRSPTMHAQETSVTVWDQFRGQVHQFYGA